METCLQPGAHCSRRVSGSIDPQLGSMPGGAEHLSVPLLSGAEQLESFLLQLNLELGLQDMTGTEARGQTQVAAR